jgi:hypothetical protein
MLVQYYDLKPAFGEDNLFFQPEIKEIATVPE